jgi:hypothetical protein
MKMARSGIKEKAHFIYETLFCFESTDKVTVGRNNCRTVAFLQAICHDVPTSRRFDFSANIVGPLLDLRPGYEFKNNH